MFTSRSQPPTTLMPASPPSSGYDKHSSLSILPKPLNSEFYSQKERPELLSPPQNYYGNNSTSTRATTTSSSSSFSSSSAPHTPYSSSSTAPDQNTLWALFSQFQQQQKKNGDPYGSHRVEERRGSDSNDGRVLSSEEVLAEKRRRNAGASARFRDRRKQRERELQDKCNELEQRSKEFENALRRVEPEHPLLSKQSVTVDYSNRSNTSSPPPMHEDNNTLFDRVGQLEHLMTRFRQEKETDVQKLDELEKENKYLKSLLIPVSLPQNNRRSHVENTLNKRIRLSHSRDSSDIEN
ncbi:hypothetical protein INT48_007792 [Thamnidium elegans]|uniref:BZIP domain-containing protein n=1 Tax=Thamnidium elegans TaxID=101142 RepID=A0A8H7VVC7_9FUNG|nr:hypothetical protein INT48_007792 [Thamnidium elegans]